MLKASSEEYKILKNETAEIRSCINKYIGYIISISGVGGLVLQYLKTNDMLQSNITLLIILLTFILITLLFDIIWYKFKSHNRYVGYMQLMMQEVNFGELTKDVLTDSKKSYLDELQLQNKSFTQNVDPLYTWEFIMSRFSAADFQQSKNALLKATDKAFFAFKIPQNFSFSNLPKEIYTKLDRDFFQLIVYPIYSTDEKKRTIIYRFKYLFLDVFKLPKLIKFTYSRLVAGALHKDINLDKKYFTSSWQYPKKITQITFVPVTFIYIFLVYFVLTRYDLEACFTSFSVANLIPLASVIFGTGLYAFWIKRYLVGLTYIMTGEFSVEYYCWSFFVFRIQLLNSLGIIPVYFSRNFIRFFKSKYLLNEIERSKKSLLKKEKCIMCAKHGEEDKLREIDEDDIYFCQEHLSTYVNALEKCQAFGNRKVKYVHEIIYKKFVRDVLK